MKRFDDTMFTLLDQRGPFPVTDRAPLYRPFSIDARKSADRIISKQQQTKYRVLRNQVFEMLNIQSFSEIKSLLYDEERRRTSSESACRLLGNMFGLSGSRNEIVSAINGYSRTADSVIRYLKNKVLANFASHIEMTNEIDVIANPVDLLLIMFDDGYHKKARFEARRKLLLMSLSASIDQRERETGVERNFSGFLDFLNRYVWMPGSKIGELDLVYILSEHDPTDFSCRNFRIVNGEEYTKLTIGAGQKLTLLKRRRFLAGSREVPIYVSIRKKPPEAKVLKLLRKGEENPAVAVDDELGLMGVVNDMADVKAFQHHLTKSARKANSFMSLEDIADSLSPGWPEGSGRKKNVGSSASTRMLKFFARLGGMRVEFIMHTNESYLDYIYRCDVAHDEYEVKRIFDTGVAQLLFPEEIYHLDLEMAKEYQLKWFRAQIERC